LSNISIFPISSNEELNNFNVTWSTKNESKLFSVYSVLVTFPKLVSNVEVYTTSTFATMYLNYSILNISISQIICGSEIWNSVFILGKDMSFHYQEN